MDKIYSRPRIRLKNKIPRKRDKIKTIFIIIIVLIFSSIYCFIKAGYPVFIATCKNAATSLATNILNKEVNEVMLQYGYEDLVNIQKGENGNVSYIEAKIIPINEIVAKITNNVQEKLDKNSVVSVKVNWGSISGISALSAISPKLNIAVERAGDLKAEIESEFISVGINQTLHRIYLDLNCEVVIFSPFETVYKTVPSQVLLTETVIVGEVPSTYYDYENLGFEDVLQTIN